MKLIIHCGESKTGSSSIQTALKSSSAKLIKKSILYYSENNNGHFDFGYIVGKRHRVPKDKDYIYIDRVKRTITETKKLVSEFKPKFLVLSSEKFFGYTENEITKTIDALGLEFTDIYCIVYVRCPTEYYLSATQQYIKASHRIYNPITFKRDIATPLKRWKNFVGQENFVGSIFHKKTLSHGDVVADFIEKLEKITQEKIEFNKYSVSNESITAEQMVLLQNYRYDFLRNYDNQFMPSSSNLLKFFLRLNRIELLGVKPELRPEIKEVILFNNSKYIIDVDNLLGGNSMSELSGLLTESPSSSCNVKSIERVEDIVSSYSLELYNILKNIIIEYNDDLKLAYKDYLTLFIDSDESRTIAASIYFDYLKSNHYFSSAQLKKIKNTEAKGYGDMLYGFLK